MAWPSSIPTFTALATLPAASLNLIRDALNVLGGAWTTYTPTLTAATTSPTMGASSITGRYRLAGKTADIHIEFTVGSGYAAGSGVYRFSLPSGCAPINTGVNSYLGGGNVVDVSTATYVASVYYVSPTVVSVEMAATSTPLSHNSPVATWASGDRVSIHLPALEIV